MKTTTVKKTNPVAMIAYWTIYLTLTMALFERFNIVPATIPLGIIGWGVIVELPRMIVGFLISKAIFR